MLKNEILVDYAKLVLKVGVNLQAGQALEIACPVEKYQVAEIFAEQAYQMGAGLVRIRWENQNIDKLSYQFAKEETLCDIPKWLVDCRNSLVEKGFCYVAISADDPSKFKDIPAEKLGAVAKARAKALKKFSDAVMANKIRWCVVSVPTLSWAKQVFPTAKDPEKELAVQLERAMRLDQPNPIEAWQKHIERLEKRAEFLNYSRFEYIKFENAKGTNLKVGLADDHVWISAREKAQDGVHFVANMPTEELFTAPHRLKVDGVLKSALPLCENGQIIDDFTLTFKDGEIIDYSATIGYQTLKQLIETDPGTKRLGEIALIGKNSPIAKSGVLFYNTLFDENASCHLAIGKGYPTTIKDGEKLDVAQLKQMGLNDATDHFDFMIGTADLKVTGIKKDGSEVHLFIDGEWVI